MGGRVRSTHRRGARGCTAADSPRRALAAGSPPPLGMSGVVYDAAVLIAADRGDRSVWAEHRALLESGVVPLVPAAVLAQVSRSQRQVQLRRILRGCIVVALDEASAHASGRLLAISGDSDVVDASVVVLAIRARARIVTGDAGDIERLIRASGVSIGLTTL